MSEVMWMIAGEERLRHFIMQQDARFQRAMRVELQQIAAERGIRLTTKAASRARPRPAIRDVINIPTSIPSDMPLSDAQRIMKEVCVKHRVTRAELTGKQRAKNIVIARQEAAYRLKTETTMSLPQIGRRLGGKDHTTVLHSVRRHIAQMEAAH
jgi:chromosomal replication initiation ATPase DnaA